METYIGIDFGTTNTRVAVGRPDEMPVALPIGTGGRAYIPSVVALKREPNGPPTVYEVGELAAALPDSEDVLVLENLKRCLMYRLLPREEANLPHWWDRELGTIRAWGYSIDPLEVVAAIISSALRTAERAARIYGFRLTEEDVRNLPITVGCPAYSGYDIHCMVTEAMHRAGNERCCIGGVVEEPNLTAAAYAALQVFSNRSDLSREQPRKVLIYDLGGGTFDTAIVEVQFVGRVPRLVVLGSDCLPFTGGMDIDKALREQLMGRIAEAAGTSVEEMSGGLLDWEKDLLLRRVREVKEELTLAPETHETQLTVEFRGARPLAVPVTRKDIDAALDATNIVEETLECCLRAYRRARMYLDRRDAGGFDRGITEDGKVGPSVLKIQFADLARGVDDVILVGGSTAIPNLRKRLLRRFGMSKVLGADEFLDPITANCVGAALPRERYAPAVLTRAAYWVRLRCGDATSNLYRPFDPYLEYDFSWGIPGERPLCRSVDLSGADEAAVIISACDDGDVHSEKSFMTKRAHNGVFAFDRYGTIHICDQLLMPDDARSMEHHTCDDETVLYRNDTPPWQHDYQREMLEELRNQEKNEQERKKQRLNENLARNPSLDNN